ncbi:class I SAM-dependent methyltransferase [Hymenobacter guriensis]|uniref:Class I SAM-dependent methyltransferase n=1 Tax=Hymenobacter guriensis TaxID=2793065 RepID=A0ABS0L1X3_9BACT|nr:class I SAM-dependent methyltransferase [Hymenobacter guriensis]MBG8554107.1 class I SAM-dependent methyltransferase [Hymenobacter guriensis]
MLPFSDPQAVARYAERPPRIVPGFADLHRMSALLLAERMPAAGRILVIGAGGGLELKTFAEFHPGWQFDGVDPSAEMLRLALATLGPLATRVQFHEGYIDAAPAGPFDAATCLLTCHFLPLEERRHLLQQVLRRLQPGAPFVVAHHSFPQHPDEQAVWLARYAAFSVAAGGADQAQAEAGTAIMAARLSVLSPQQDEALLREAGFANVSLFYAGFTFRGWVAYKP